MKVHELLAELQALVNEGHGELNILIDEDEFPTISDVLIDNPDDWPANREEKIITGAPCVVLLVPHYPNFERD